MIAFAEPVALLALLALVPVLAAVAHGAARRRAADAAFGGDPALRRGRSPRRNFLRTSMLVASMALVAVVVARPQWGDTDQPVTRRGIDVVIALDVSRSMTATDVAPTRAGAAAAGLRNMLDHLRGDRVGLVTFAGDAFVRSPLTLDLDAVRQLVSQAQEEPALVRPGTNLGRAIQSAIRLLDIDDPAQTQAIVLVSDGEDLAGGQLDVALRTAEESGVRVYTAAAGTAEGAEIAHDTSGGTQRSRLDRATLRRIAGETGGDLRDVNTIAGLAVEFARLRQSEFEAAEQPAPVERFQWFLGAALLLLLAQALVATGSRPAPLRVGRITLGSAALLAGLALVACGGSAAYQRVQSGNNAYEAGRYDEALSSYRSAAEAMPDEPEISYNIGNTLHQLRRYEEATVASEAAASETADARLLRLATYAIGSHAFRRDALEEARDAFVDVLLRDPQDDDARHNLAIVLLALTPPEPPAAQAAPAGEEERPEGNSEQPDGGTQPAGPSPAPAGAGDDGSQPPASGDPAAGAAPGDSNAMPDELGEEARAAALEQSQLALAAALDEFGEEVTFDEALAILDLVRRVNALTAAERSQPLGGLLPPR